MHTFIIYIFFSKLEKKITWEVGGIVKTWILKEIYTSLFVYSNLYHVVTTEIQKRGILNIDLYDVFEKDISRCIQFLKDFNYILTSTLKIKLVLPTYVMLCQVEHLKGKLLQLVDVCHARISDYYAYENVPISLLEIVLPKMTNLKKIYILGTGF